MDLSPSEKKLLRLLGDARFCSGSDLAAELGISRTGVWKKLRGLSELGLEFSAVSGRGYRLKFPLQLLDGSTICTGLDDFARERINDLFIHDRIDSTNGFLVDRLRTGEVGGQVCLAESQTAGKGRSGRTWVSPYGCNVYLSLSWRFECGPGSISGLSLAIGVAVMRALHSFEIQEVGLKWPNDVLCKGKKLGGILVEVFGDAHGPCSAVVGLGLNAYLPHSQAEEISQSWIDLHTIMDRKAPDRNRLVSVLLNQIVLVTSTIDQTGLDPYLTEWRQWDCMAGKLVVLHLGDQTIEGSVQGINDSGLIRLLLDSGEVREFASGEVSFRAD